MFKLRPGLVIACLITGLIGALFFVAPQAQVSAQSSWCYIFDFSLSDGGWSSFSLGQYSDIWRHTDGFYAGGARRAVGIERNFTSTTLTLAAINFDLTKGNYNGAASAVTLSADSDSTILLNVSPGLAVDGDDQWKSWSGSVSTTNFRAWVQSSADWDNPYSYSGSTAIRKIELHGQGTNPFGSDNCGSTTTTPTFTPSPTSMFTPTASGNLALLSRFGFCGRMNDKAYFLDLTNPDTGWAVDHAFRPPQQNTGVLIPSGGTAWTRLSLDPRKAYEIEIVFRALNPVPDQYLQVHMRTAGIAPFAVSIPESTDITSRTIEAQHYSPSSAGYELALMRMSDDPEIGLIVEYICVVERGAPGGGGAGAEAVCADCTYAPVGDLLQDMPQLILWLGCVFRRVIECELVIAIGGIWARLSDVLLFLASFLVWLSQTFQRLFETMNDNLGIIMRFFQGEIANLAIRIENALKTVMVPAVTDVQNIPIAVSNGIQSGVAITNQVRNVGTDALSFLGNLVGSIINGLAQLFQVVPTAIDGIFSGFNEAAIAPLTGAPTCSDPGEILYYPCLGFYILENTVFQGPALYVVPFIMAALAWDTLTWVVTRIREVINK